MNLPRVFGPGFLQRRLSLISRMSVASRTSTTSRTSRTSRISLVLQAILLSLISLLLLAATPAVAAAPPDPAALEFRQHPGRAMPLVQGLRDQDGRAVSLQDYLGTRPVVFVLGYYHCPMLCSTLMDAVLQRLHGIGVPYEVVSVSIDPTETPEDAARKYGYYSGLMNLGSAGGQGAGAPTVDKPRNLHLLTATPSAIAALTQAVGFPYQRDPATGQFYHPAGFVVLTTEGRISRYFLGVDFVPRDVRLALVEASRGKVGGLADRLVLLCSHYDPTTGRYNVAAMAMARAAGLGTLAALLAGLAILHRRRRAGDRRRMNREAIGDPESQKSQESDKSQKSQDSDKTHKRPKPHEVSRA